MTLLIHRRMPALCESCPFRTDGKAIELRPGRIEGIRAAVTLGADFACHKTTHGAAPEEKFCAGAWEHRMASGRDLAKVRAALDLILGRPLGAAEED